MVIEIEPVELVALERKQADEVVLDWAQVEHVLVSLKQVALVVLEFVQEVVEWMASPPEKLHQ